MRAAEIIVTEVGPVKVMPIMEAARIGDVFVTVTGNKHSR